MYTLICCKNSIHQREDTICPPGQIRAKGYGSLDIVLDLCASYLSFYYFGKNVKFCIQNWENQTT